MSKPAEPRPPGPPVEIRIAILLGRLGTRQLNTITELLRPLGLRAKEFAVMNAVAHTGEPSQQAIGAAMEIDPSGLIATIDALEERGWLERRRDPADRRRNMVVLTDAGRAKLDEGRAVARQRAEQLLEPLSSAERQALLELLSKVDEGG